MSNGSPIRLAAAGTLIAGLVTALPACSSGGPGEPWKVQGRHVANNFTEIVEESLSAPNLEEFDRGVLERAKETGRLEQADYDEAYRRFADCMEFSGEPVKLKKLSNGLYRMDTTPLSPGETLESAVAVVDKCSNGTINHIASLFGTQQGNPELLLNPYEIAYKCLESKDLVGSSLTFEKFAEVFNSPDSKGAWSESLGFDVFDDEAQACFIGANITLVGSGS
ncbi:hypothetical protein [Arthrobacter sp. M4]|uniref:hypothetical protein n=1 Tax=Arthrobacter sp. M4 TaxID=218160 RepID=UPI001CDD4E0E|nr:hypothetical protein [Arthrobacter sp. M4]MCA4131277.1 hypothetical protein [Arthrobacter sp. M4]